MVLMDFLGYDIDIPYELPYYIYIWLVVWNMNFMFHSVGNVIIPTDFSSYFSEVVLPPTRL
jgi:hypothetical protein